MIPRGRLRQGGHRRAPAPILTTSPGDFDGVPDPARNHAAFWRFGLASLEHSLAVYRDPVVYESATLEAGFDRVKLLDVGAAEVGVAWTGNLGVVSARGSSEPMDWLLNAVSLARVGFQPHLPKRVKIGLGFREQVRRVLPQVVREIELRRRGRPHVELVLTGHSLGAAMATILVPALSRLPGCTVRATFLFESPRVGGPRWAEWFDREFAEVPVWSFVNVVGDARDVVCRMPFAGPFQHVRLEDRVILLPDDVLFGREAWQQYREANPLPVVRRYFTRAFRAIEAHRGPVLLERVRREVEDPPAPNPRGSDPNYWPLAPLIAGGKSPKNTCICP